MTPHFAPVPVVATELRKEVTARDLRVTRSSHRAGRTIARHAHRQATVTLLVHGSFDESYPYRRDIACTAPAVHVRPPGEPHRDRMGTAGAINLVLEIDDPRFDEVRRHSRLFDEVRHLRSERLLEIARRLDRELWIDDDASPLSIEGLALELVGTASRCTRPTARQRAPWLRRVYELVHDRFRERPLGLDALAEVAQVHPVHLARTFRSVYGRTPGELQRELRVDWAMHQLLATERSLAEIATAAGFSDQSHFSRVFKAFVGEPPGAWRRSQPPSGGV